MSNEALTYIRRLDVRHSPVRKFVLQTLGDMVADDTKSWVIQTSTLAADCTMDVSVLRKYLLDLLQDGYISILDRTESNGRQKAGRIIVHGPWDLWGGTGQPFPEVRRPKNSKRLDATQPIKLTPELQAELTRRYEVIASEDGAFADGAPRSTFRLGCRAHSIVCWYGRGRVVLHQGRAATVTEITDREGKKKTPVVRVRLAYLDDDTVSEGWIDVTDLEEPPVPTATTDQENPSSEGEAISPPSPPEGEATLRPHGEATLRPHGEATLRPHPASSEQSSSSSALPPASGASTGGGGHREDDEETASPMPRPLRVVDSLVARVGATSEEADAVIDRLRQQAQSKGREIESLTRYVAGIPDEDLEEHLAAVRRAAAQGPGGPESPSPRPARRVMCDIHGGETPCALCRVDLSLGGDDAARVLALVQRLGDQAALLRPDLTAHPALRTASGAA